MILTDLIDLYYQLSEKEVNAMLDNILSRLGIYDLMGVLYTGTIISVTLWFINSVFDIVNLQFQALDVMVHSFLL